MRPITSPTFRSPLLQFTEKAKFAGLPCGAMTVLSNSTVALSMTNPAQIEVWDWRAGKCVRTLTGFCGGIRGIIVNAVLPDGRLVAGDDAGTIRVGLIDNWAAATVISNGDGLLGVLTGHDGSFVTADRAGNIKLWRNGACEVTLTGGVTRGGYSGVPLAVIGRRLITVGDNGALLVAE